MENETNVDESVEINVDSNAIDLTEDVSVSQGTNEVRKEHKSISKVWEILIEN